MAMQKNEAYGFTLRNQQSLNDNNYAEIVLQTATTSSAISEDKQESPCENSQTNSICRERKIKYRGVFIVIAIAIVAVLTLALIAITVSAVLSNNSNLEVQSLQQEIESLREMLNLTGDNSNLEVQSLQQEMESLREMLNQTGDNSNQEIESLREMLNQTGGGLAAEISALRADNLAKDDLTHDLQDTLQEELDILRNNLSYTGTFFNPVSSCSDIPRDSPSGDYWIQTRSSNSPVQVYCDMNRTCNITGGWMRVANLDMTDPSQQCPDGFRLMTRTTAPLRTCGRPDDSVGCVSVTFPVHGIEYSHVCGRVIGYQLSAVDGFLSYYRNRQLTIDSAYVDGVSLTHGQSPRQHIWTFAAAHHEITANNLVCPCTRPDLTYTGVVPPFISQDYFCETGSRSRLRSGFFPDDPLWDGDGCGGTSTCCSLNNPPWFCKQLGSPSTEDIELRLCGSGGSSGEDTPLEFVDIFVQ